jgi:hypothetical protein
MQQPLLDLREEQEEAKENRRRLPRRTLVASLLGGVVAGVAMFWIFQHTEKLPAAETHTAAVLLPLPDDQPAARNDRVAQRRIERTSGRGDARGCEELAARFGDVGRSRQSSIRR